MLHNVEGDGKGKHTPALDRRGCEWLPKLMMLRNTKSICVPAPARAAAPLSMQFTYSFTSTRKRNIQQGGKKHH